MVYPRKVLRVLKNRNSIVYSSIVVTIVTVIIKALGLIKQAVLASVCGANPETDAYFVATGIIGQLAVVLFSAISISLLSMYSRQRVNTGISDANDLITGSLIYFLPVAIIISFIFYSFASPIAYLLAPTYSFEQRIILVHYIRITSFAFLPWCYYLTVNVVLEANNIFVPGKLQGFFQNIFIIIAALALYPILGIDVLVYAFLLSGVVESVVVTIIAKKYYVFNFRERNSKIIKQLIPLTVPLIIGNAIYEINDIVDKQISLSLGGGYASVLTYGSTINEIVTGVIVSSVATVLYANYSNWAAENRSDLITNNIEQSIKILTFIIVPIMVLCLLSGDQIVSILYGHGNFKSDDIHVTYLVVIGYAIGFLFQSARAILVKVFYAYQDTKTPLINGSIAIAVNIVFSIVLSRYIGVMGISLATSIGMGLVTLLLLVSVKKHVSISIGKDTLIDCFKSIISGLVVSFPIFFIKRVFDLGVFIPFIIETVICLIGYCLVLKAIKSESITLIHSYIKNKIER